MRRVDSEGDSLGNRGSKRVGGRPGSSASRSHLRRASLESLETRELLSTLPTPVLASAANLVATQKPTTASANSPSIAVDPINPQKLVAAWVVHDTTNPIGGGQVTSYVQGAFSINGGLTWRPLGAAGSANVQTDFTASQANGPVLFHVTSNATVAFGRDENAYLLTSTTTDDGTSGTIDLQRFAFTGNAPTQTLTNKAIYNWDSVDSGGPDSAQTPTLTVDNNLPAFVDTSSTGKSVVQNDPYAGNIYVAWAETDTNTGPIGITNFNPQSIRIVASSDNGSNFTHAAYVDDVSNSNINGSHASGVGARYVEPTLAVSQGRAPGTLSASDPGVPGGQVTIVYDDYGTGNTAAIPFDRILSQTNLVGGSAQVFNAQAGVINGATANPVSGGADIPGITNFPFAVNITDSKFSTVQSLDVTLGIIWPSLQELSAVLVPPPALAAQGFQPITLFTNGVDGLGATVPGGLTGTNLGSTTGTGFGPGSGTVFDSASVRSIRDGNTKAPYVGHFRPVGGAALQALQGLSAGQLNGTWNLQITAFKVDTATTGMSLARAAIDFGSGNNPGFLPQGGVSPEVVIANNRTLIAALTPGSNPTNPSTAFLPIIRGNTTGVSASPSRLTTSAIQGVPIFPSPSIAIDNTLGAYSKYQGRIYVSYTGRYDGIAGIAKDQTDIFLLASDDGGQSWSALSTGFNDGVQVNDDNAATDGFSEGSPGDPNPAQPTGRPQLEPKVAVDQSTGNVVLSFLDARNDASRARVSTYIAASSDGGATFAPETYANLPNTAIDSITGKTVILGPTPDNQSGGSNQDAFGFGQRQGLAVANGKIIPIWSSNENLGFKGAAGTIPLTIRSSVLTEPDGPRILSSTQGPIGELGDTVNTTRAADGSPVANTFLINFDRPIDPATFQGDGLASTNQPIGTGDVRVFYQDPYASTTGSNTTPVSGLFGTLPFSSMLTFSGHPGIPVVDGQVTIKLAGFTNLGNVTIQLVGPAGQIQTIPTTAGTTSLNVTVPLQANMVGGAVDGTYALRIASSTAQTGTFQGFGLQLNGVSTGLRVISVTPVPNLADPNDDGSLGYTQFKVVFDPTNPNNLVPTSVGTYSYIVRPDLSDRIRSIPSTTFTTTAPNQNFVGPAALNIVGGSSTITVTGEGNQFFQSGTISASFASATAIGTAQVTLTTPNGRIFTVFKVTNAGPTLNLNNVALPFVPASFLLNGSYKLGLTTNAAAVALTSWSLNLNGSTATANFSATTITENAQFPQVPSPLLGTTTTNSDLYLVGHPGKTISSGTLRLSLTDTTVNHLTITLIAPGGQMFVLPASIGTALNQSYALPANFVGLVVDGRYRLQISNGTATDLGTLNSWSLQIVAAGANGNAMDQNSDGTPGQDPETTAYTGLTAGDDFITPTPSPTTAVTFSGPGLPAGPYTNGSLPLIVSGPHVIATTVSGTGTAGTTTGTTADNLVANDQVGSVGLIYDRNVQVASVTGSSVLNIVGPAGVITGPQTFNSGGIAKTFNSTDVNRLIPKGTTGLLSSLLVATGTNLTVSSLKVTVNITDVNDANLTLALVAPDGTTVPLVATGVASGANFSNTTFSDTPNANGLTIPIASGTAPYGLTYQPSSALAAFKGKFLDGNWQLKIIDGSAAGITQGRLNNWSLAITPTVPQGGMLNSTLAIPSSGNTFTIAHLAVQLNITAPRASDISVYLIAPDGSIISLFQAVGGTGSNFTNTTLDDSSTVSIASGVAPFTQVYKPTTPAGTVTLTSQIGKVLDGTWTLRIVDPVTGTPANAVTLNSWSLIATPQIKVTPSETYISNDVGAQNYVSTDTSPQVYPSGAPSPTHATGDATFANPLTIGSALGSTVTSQIVIPSTGGTFNLANLKIALNITYSRDTNLSAFLIAPDGTTVPLFAGVGGTGANFGDFLGDYTIFGDSGAASISQGTAPFVSGPLSSNPSSATIFRPSSALSALIGKPLDGTWTLQVINNQTNGPVGTFNGWALIATPQAAAAANSLPAGATQPAEPIPVVDPSVFSPSLVSSISFPITGGVYSIASLAATLNLTAGAGGNLADLTALLVAPDGTTATLFSAGDGTVTGTGSSTVTLTPLNAISGQSQFANVILDGTWNLEIFDSNTSRASNVLNAWSLTPTPKATALKQAPEPIPNTPASSLTSTINITDNVALSGLKLRLNIGAPKDSTLTAVLIGPNGQTIRLFTNVGANGVDFANTVFSDSATNLISAGTAPFSGTFKPQDPLSSFGSITTLGSWKLKITDTVPNANGPTAVLYGWSLINTPPTGTTLANSYQIAFPTQQLSGTYAVTLSSGVLGAAPTLTNPMAPAIVPGAPSLGTAANPNLNAGVDVLKGTSTIGVIATTPASYVAASVPVSIPAAGSGGGVLTSQIVVPDNFLIQGVTAAGLPGLTVQLNITYSRDQDLAAVLIAPDGTVIRLFTNIGVGSSNFSNTVFDDTVNPAAPIDNAGNGFFGRFNPEQPLSNLAGHSSGGTWTLQITNSGTIINGTLNSFSLTFQQPLPSSGLGDPVADRQTVDFRLFNIAPTNSLANDTWTAVGPAGVTVTPGQTGTFAGSVASIAYDPSDPTRNTVYVASASGGIWKTTNFLTTNPGGPTYQPLTDFGPNYSLNVGSIAIFGRNSDPNQSIVIAGTGFAQASYPYGGGSASYNNYGGATARGVGFLRSFDGGLNWGLLDSTVNVDSSGNPLPINSPLRDHKFVGTDTYKVVVDPTPLPNGNLIIYAALGAPNGGSGGGLYRSIDSGNTWTLLQAGTATDVILDPASKSPSTGNIDIVYAAIQGQGVFISSNRGQSFSLLTGQLGKDPLIQGPGFPAQAAIVGNAGVTPNGAKGRIVLSKPALTGNAAVDLLYQDWLYAAVETPDGHLDGLYITKDRGQNWTKAQLLDVPNTLDSVTPAVPTNDNAQTTSYDPTANQPSDNFSHNGNYNLTLTIDPTNPNIVYLGGTQDFQATGLLRVDLTNIHDAHNLTSFSNDQNDGGKLQRDSAGAINVGSPTTVYNNGVTYNPPTNSYALAPTPYLNFRHAPNTPNVPGTSPFNVNATLVIIGRASQVTVGATDFNNDGIGVKWSYLDEPLKANAGDLTGSSNLHYSTAFIDPLTGNVRLLLADDQGVFTALLNPDGTLDNGIGNAVSANYSRNGNLQNEQFYYGSAQPSNLAAQAAGALFYASGQGLLAAQSDPNILSNGNITWDDSAVLTPVLNGPRDTSANASIISSDRGGVGIATDPTGSGSVYEFDIPSLGGNLTDFFRVNGVGQTTGLDNNIAADFPFGSFHFNGSTGNDGPQGSAVGPGDGLIPLGEFTINPLNGSQILISSATGTLYQTTNKGVAWLPIGTALDFGGGTTDLHSAYAPAVAYGAPDPNGSGGIGNLNNFIYVGTVGSMPSYNNAAHNQAGIYVTQTGGQSWTNVSSGLDGSSVVGIYPSPDRGSHAAYAVTLHGVYYTPDSLATPAAGQTTWINITGNLTQIQHNSFGNASLAESILAPYNAQQTGNQSSTNPGGFRSLVADYRYAIPDPNDPTKTNPVLYVAGYGGVFRSLDNGQTWTVFPNTAFDAAPVDGGYLPSVEVESLQLNLGSINPATGRPTEVLGDPEVLLATTYGRGEFAIRLAPDVFPNTISLDANLPAPTGSDSGPSNIDRITNVSLPYIDGISEITNYGNVVTITLIDESNGNILATGYTNALGQFSIKIGTYITSGTALNDPSFLLDGVKNVGIQATDSAGAKGNVTTFTYTLKATHPNPTGAPVLEPTSASGYPLYPNVTNITNPTFDIATTEPATTTVTLYRFNPKTGLYDILIGSAPAGVNPVKITDNNLAALALNNPINTLLMYEAIQTDIAGNASAPSNILTIAVKTTLPPTLAAPTLEPGSNSGLNKSQLITNVQQPFFDATNLESGDLLVLYRSSGGSTPVKVGTATGVGVTRVQDTTPKSSTPDGTYVYYVAQVDIATNVSKLSPGTVVMINTQSPAQPTLSLLNADDSGLPNHPNVTNVRTPRFLGTGTAGLGITILAYTGNNFAGGVPIASTTVASDGTYLAQVTSPLADGTYNLVARTVNAAGNISYSTTSPPFVVTIKANGPQIIPSLSIFGADDTGIKGDGVTASRRPRFAGITDPGDTVTLYALINGVLSAPQAMATASTINGSFQFQLPFDLTDGSAQLVAQATDVAGNKGPISPILNVRIISVAGDYYDLGYAQFAVFRPTSETYIVRNAGSLQVDTTPGRDIPVQYDFNGDGKTDLSAYRYDAAQYYGFLSNNSVQTQQFGQGGNSLPVSGYYDSSGTFIYALFNPNTATWAVNVPRNGGVVVNFGVAGTDIPVPAAYNGGGITEIANFRGKNVFGNDADSFNVVGSDFTNNYQVSFTDPAVVAKGFVYKAGDIPAPADYDGLGRDEFAIYRPTTGQFFILNTPNLFDKTTWTLRTVTLNIPGGPRVGDQPAPEDYEGTGKASPTVYRPSNSTFYEIQTTNGIQQNIQFGQPGVDVAAAGPLQYRLSALFNAVTPPGGGTGSSVILPTTGGGGVQAASFKGSTTTTAASTSPAELSTIALATPTTVVTPSASVTIPVTPAPVATSLKITPVAPAVAATNPVPLGAIGYPNPRFTVATPVGPKAEKLSTSAKKVEAKAKATHHVTTTPKHLTVDTSVGQAKTTHHTTDQHHKAVEAALKHLGPIKKGRSED